MLKIFTKASATGALVAALTATSLLLAPGAQAATHKVSAGYDHQNQHIKVAKHEDVLKLDAVTKSGFLISPKYKGYAATRYRVTLTDGKKHVLLRKVVSGYRAEAALEESYTHKSFKSDAALKAHVSKVLSLSEAKAKKLYQTIASKIAFEFSVAPGISFAVLDVQEWVSANPGEATFDVYLPGQPPVSTTAGITFALTGVPAAWHYVISDKASGLSVSYDSTTAKITHSGGWVDYHISTKF